MKTTFAYRIEHKKEKARNQSTWKKIKSVNRGPYIGAVGTVLEYMSDEHNCDLSHPSIRTDIVKWYYLGDKSGNHVCCFKTKKQMKKWFKGWFQTLHEEGFILVKYRIEYDALIMGCSNLQGIFNSDKIIKRNVVDNLVNMK